jgi:hypothetical protein
LLEYVQFRCFSAVRRGEGARLTLCPSENAVLEQKEKAGVFRTGFCFSKNSPGYFRARAIRVPCKMSSAKLP